MNTCIFYIQGSPSIRQKIDVLKLDKDDKDKKNY